MFHISKEYLMHLICNGAILKSAFPEEQKFDKLKCIILYFTTSVPLGFMKSELVTFLVYIPVDVHLTGQLEE